jgi:hypothetical protein
MGAKTSGISIHGNGVCREPLPTDKTQFRALLAHKREMYYRCRTCKQVEYRGILPGATCGLLYFAQMGIALGVLLPTMNLVFPNGFGWWWLLVFPLALVLGFFGAVLIDLILKCTEWICILCHRCPHCSTRKW